MMLFSLIYPITAAAYAPQLVTLQFNLVALLLAIASFAWGYDIYRDLRGRK